MADPHLSQSYQGGGGNHLSGHQWGAGWRPLVEEVNWPYHEVNMRMRAAAGRLWVVSADNSFPALLRAFVVLQPNGQWAQQAPRQGEQ